MIPSVAGAGREGDSGREMSLGPIPTLFSSFMMVLCLRVGASGITFGCFCLPEVSPPSILLFLLSPRFPTHPSDGRKPFLTVSLVGIWRCIVHPQSWLTTSWCVRFYSCDFVSFPTWNTVQIQFVFSGPFQIPFPAWRYPYIPQADVTLELNTHCIPACAVSCDFTNTCQRPLLALFKRKKHFWLKTLRVKQTKSDNIRLERKWGLPWTLQGMACGTVWYIRTRTQRVAGFLLPFLCRLSPGLRLYLSFLGTGSRIWDLGLKACGVTVVKKNCHN